MGSNIPVTAAERVAWCETHLPLWAATPTKFGLTAGQVTQLTTETTAARAALNAAIAARQASKNATVAQDKSVRTMFTDAASLVAIIKGFIENTGNQALWAQAGIEPPAGPGTAAAPTAPFQLATSVDALGNIILTWKARQPRGVSGVVYSIRRAIDGGALAPLDTVGEKNFIDETVPIGTHTLTYTIQAKRGSQTSGWSDALTVRFGRVGGGGFAIVSQTTEPNTTASPTKLAA